MLGCVGNNLLRQIVSFYGMNFSRRSRTFRRQVLVASERNEPVSLLQSLSDFYIRVGDPLSVWTAVNAESCGCGAGLVVVRSYY